MKKAVCLISGGLDSCVSAYIAKKKGFEIYVLSFNYGQRHDKEINCAKQICKSLHVKKHIIFDINLSLFGDSSLTDKKMKPETDHEIKDIEVSTEEQIQFILDSLQQTMQIPFIDLIAHFKNKIIMIVTFIALLELIKRGQVIVKQAMPFGEIWIQKH